MTTGVLLKWDLFCSQASILEISESETSELFARGPSRRSEAPQPSPAPASPRKSALKDPLAKRNSRKHDSIKFDLSNLDNYVDDQSDVLTVNDTTKGMLNLSINEPWFIRDLIFLLPFLLDLRINQVIFN